MISCATLVIISFFLFASYAYSPHCAKFFFFFNDPAPTEISTLSLHDALPISARMRHDDDLRRRIDLEMVVDVAQAIRCLRNAIAEVVRHLVLRAAAPGRGVCRNRH